MFSDGFSEGQPRDINGEFPSDSLSYTEDYDYLSDSDLEEDDEETPEDHRNSRERSKDTLDPRALQAIASDPSPQYLPSVKASETQDNDR